MPGAVAGRHHALFMAARDLAKFVRHGRATAKDVEYLLIAAAEQCGIDDDLPELQRTIRNGLRAGGVEL